ncbi:DUF1499 domain-containing protein [Marinobacter antarcticus]|nr:DUF1499 domain-containing protein [Marinobacter antarcticus]
MRRFLGSGIGIGAGVRSQSLIGFYDLGVDRRRIELLRSRLIERGIAVD